MEKVDYTESTADIADDLSYLYATKDEYDDPEGLLDEVHDLRKKYAADLEPLVVLQLIIAYMRKTKGKYFVQINRMWTLV